MEESKLIVVDKAKLVALGKDKGPEGGDLCRTLGFKINHDDDEPRRARVKPEAYRICGLCTVKNARIYVAGGAVTAAFIGKGLYNNRTKMIFTEGATFSDIDVYLFAETLEVRKKAINELMEKLSPTHMVRSEFALTMYIPDSVQLLVFDPKTFISQYGGVDTDRAIRKIQVIFDPARSMEEVLDSYDLDCCCVCTDGSEYYALPRFVRALSTRVNIMDAAKKGGDTIKRVAKYFCRGFDIVGLDRSEIDKVLTYLTWPVDGEIGHLEFVRQVDGWSYEKESIYDSSPINDAAFLEMVVSIGATDYRNGERCTLRCIGWELGVSKLRPSEFLETDRHETEHVDHWKYAKLGRLCEFYERNVLQTDSTELAKVTLADGIEEVAKGVATLRILPIYTITMAELRKKYGC